MSNRLFFKQFTRVSLAVALLVAALHGALWYLFRTERWAPDFSGKVPGMSYTAFEGKKRERGDGFVPTPEQIRADMRAMAPITRSVRTYTVTEGSDLIPTIAAEFGIKTSIGAWLDSNPDRNQREIDTAIRLANTTKTVESIYVGNELNVRAEVPLLMGEKLTPAEEAAMASKDKDRMERVVIDHLIRVIKKVRTETGNKVKLTTGEIYTLWLKYPELVDAVDYISIHVLPYWEGTPANEAVDSAIEIYNTVKAAYPNKHIKIAEFGWPSAGYNRHAAVPGRIEQAMVMRDFAVRAEALKIDYNVIEAFDQPWKTFEGGVGPYWGMIDAKRDAKFAWSGPVEAKGETTAALIAVIAGFILSIGLLLTQGRGFNRVTFAQAAALSVAANVVGFWASAIYGHWTGHYFVVGAVFAFILGVVLLIPLAIVALNLIAEITQFTLGRQPRRLLQPGKLAHAGPQPKVSIHIPACREPVDMLKATLDAVARLDYPDFECIVLINNTPDEAMCKPVEEHCAKLGPRFKYINAGQVKGFKAYALDIALEHTDPKAEIIGLIDADYIVTDDWLKDLVPAFADRRVGLVQAPQDHRDGGRSVMHSAMNAEYAGFFDIGMVLRNESNAIITHGTMLLIRRKALEDAGGWSEDTICEDTDLGLSILEKGWLQHYTSRRYGHGLLPNAFQDYKKQRFRWASGGMQIVHKHLRAMFDGSTRLTGAQRLTFAAGWLSWLANESIGVALAILNIVWTPVVAFLSIAVPDKILTLPILAMLAVSLMHFTVLYKARVKVTPKEMALALMGHMSLQWTIASAVGGSLKPKKLAFIRTDKGGKAKGAKTFPARTEAIIGGLLVLSALVVYLTNYTDIRELHIFSIVMLVQSLPFFFAVTMALIERLPQKSVADVTSTVNPKLADTPVSRVGLGGKRPRHVMVARQIKARFFDREAARLGKRDRLAG